MQLILMTTVLLLAMPITGFGWAEGSNLLLDPHLVCKLTKKIRGGKNNHHHNDLCKPESALIKVITNGIAMGFKECENQFKNRRWNCTGIKKNLRKILMRDTRETGFVNAITAAAVTYAVTRACTMGDLVECSCDKNHRRNNNNNNNNNLSNSPNYNNNNNNINYNNNSGQHYYRNNNNNNKRKRINQNSNSNNNNNNNNNRFFNKKFGKNLIVPDGDWEWGGCGDNINFGLKKSKEFLDAIYKRRSDIKTLVKLHNNDAGRMAVKNLMRLECKCHGLSGSCTIRTCWLKMASIRLVGDRLKDRFDGAVKVIARNDGNSFMPEGQTIKPPTKKDLVYTEESPDFCRPNHKTGSVGTQGRECNSTSPGVDGCDLLCCNRGYDQKVITEQVNCKCIFKWCCDVTCSICDQTREVCTCK